MRRSSKIIAGLTLAAGMFGATAAFAMGDGYHHRSTTGYYHSSPSTSYYYTAPNYRSTYSYAPSGYYDNVYNPYWSYDGPLGQGSGHDMRIGR